MAIIFPILFQYSCKKDAPIYGDGGTSINQPLKQFDFKGLRPEMRVDVAEIYNWLDANISKEQQSNLQLKDIQQRFVDNHHVVKIPIKKDAALFFTKDKGRLIAYGYNWDDGAQGAKFYTGHIISYSFQDQSLKGYKYYKGKKVADGTMPLVESADATLMDRPIAIEKKMMSVKGGVSLGLQTHDGGPMSALWCLLTGGSPELITFGEWHCDRGTGWITRITSFLQSLFGASADDDEANYGNPDSPTGIWYGDSGYSGPSPSMGGGGGGGASPGNQPYQGGPLWVSRWVDTTNLNNTCYSTDQYGNQIIVEGSCSTGYWESLEIDVTEYPNTDDGTTAIELDPSKGSGEDSDTPILPSDGVTCQEYQSSTPWPTVRDVIGWQSFVKYNGSECFALAKEQIGKRNYTVSGWSATSSLIFNIYTEIGSQVNLSATKKGITYVNQALQAGTPVLVGVDYAPGAPAGNRDGTTNHFVVIVGSGIDSNGKFYRFYDNGTNQIGIGTSTNNKLYYNETSGLISGHTSVGTLRDLTYKVTQIRKSLPK